MSSTLVSGVFHHIPLSYENGYAGTVVSISITVIRLDGSTTRSQCKEKAWYRSAQQKATRLYRALRKEVLDSGFSTYRWRNSDGPRLLTKAVTKAYDLAALQNRQGVVGIEIDYRREASDMLAVTFTSGNVTESAHG